MRSYSNQIAALHGKACKLAQRMWLEGNSSADNALRDIVANRRLVKGLADIRTAFQQQLDQRGSMEEMAHAVLYR